MTKTIYGYVRVSSKEQHEDRQLIAMSKYKIKSKNIFLDKQSGKDFERPNYKRLIRKLKKNDLLIIKSIDRLGRNYEEVIKEWRRITKEIEADIVVLDMPILDTTKDKDLVGTLISDIVLQLLSYVSQNERENIRQRQAEGIAAAKQRGVKFGRPKKNYPEIYKELLMKCERKEISKNEVMKILKISNSTFYKLRSDFGIGERRKRRRKKQEHGREQEQEQD